jgi:hypothetical protein
MNYSPRYTFYLFKSGAEIDELPPALIALIEQFDTTHEQWQQAPEKEQKNYKQTLENVDAFISAKIYQLFGDKINSQQMSASDKLKALKAQASKLKFK